METWHCNVVSIILFQTECAEAQSLNNKNVELSKYWSGLYIPYRWRNCNFK